MREKKTMDLQASTLTFFLTCPFGQLTKKSTCPTRSFSCPIFLNKNDKNQRTLISNLCKMFWLLSHKHDFIPSLLIDIMIMTSLLKEINIQDIGIKRCYRGMSV
jgi:hypothetical protein